MSRRLALAGLFLALAPASTWAQDPFGSHLIPTRTALGRIGLERQWVSVVPLSGTERLIEISIADNLLFTQTSLGNFTVYDAETGQHLWNQRLGARAPDAQPASANSFGVFVTNGNRLFHFDRRNGHPVWQTEMENLASSPTACDEHRVLVGLNNGKLVAYNLKVKVGKTGEKLADRPRIAWNWQTSGPIAGRPLPGGPVVVFGSEDGKLYVVTSEERKVLWRFLTGGEIRAAVGVYGTRTVLIPSTDKNVYSVDLWTSETNWSFPSGAAVDQEPLVTDEDAYVVNSAGALSALEIKTGLARWTTSTHGGRLLAISGTRVYLESADEDLFIVDRRTGEMVADPRATLQRAGVNLREFSIGITNHLNDRLFVGTPSGLVVCLREVGQVKPRLLRETKAKPFGYIPPEGINLAPASTPPPADANAAQSDKEKAEGEPAPDEKKDEGKDGDEPKKDKEPEKDAGDKS
jgi:outer membrane protein assembly factor BamB